MSWLESAKHNFYDVVFAKPMKQIQRKSAYLKWTLIFCMLISVTSMIFSYYLYQNVKQMNKHMMAYHNHPAYNSHMIPVMNRNNPTY